MSKIERARFSVGKSLIAIIVSSTITTLIVFSIIPVDKTQFSTALLQIIGIALVQAIIIAIIVTFLFGKKPQRSVSN